MSVLVHAGLCVHSLTFDTAAAGSPLLRPNTESLTKAGNMGSGCAWAADERRRKGRRTARKRVGSVLSLPGVMAVVLCVCLCCE